jgi:hypothetical protein
LQFLFVRLVVTLDSHSLIDFVLIFAHYVTPRIFQVRRPFPWGRLRAPACAHVHDSRKSAVLRCSKHI